jgi:hypothetical protein
MLLAPVQWPVKLVAWLPDLLRPGAFCVLVLAILWFVFVQRGLPNLWHALCRGVAILVDLVVGLLLLPEYLLTTSRQEQRAPGQAVLAMGNVAERVLDGAGGLHQRHLRDPIVWKRFPWIPLAIVLVVVTLPWAVMELTSPTSAVRQELSQAYEVWRNVEAWADVDPSRRADPGVVWPPRPRVLSTRAHGRTVGITLACRVHESCHGRLILRNGKGVRLRSRLVGVPPGSTATAHVRLSETDAASNFISVRVARADPE